MILPEFFVQLRMQLFSWLREGEVRSLGYLCSCCAEQIHFHKAIKYFTSIISSFVCVFKCYFKTKVVVVTVVIPKKLSLSIILIPPITDSQ